MGKLVVDMERVWVSQDGIFVETVNSMFQICHQRHNYMLMGVKKFSKGAKKIDEGKAKD